MARVHERRWQEGTAREVRPGVWRAERPRATDATGRTVRPSRTFKGDGAQQRAVSWARGDPEPAIVLLGDFLDVWLGRVQPTISVNTYENYRRAVLACKPLAGRPLAELTTVEWQSLANALLKRWSRYHVQIWKGYLSVALRTAIPGHRPDNPTAGVKLPRRQEEPPKAWTQAEIDNLLNAASGGIHEPWLIFSLGTGVRLGEARALLWADVDLAAKTATIRASIDNNRDTRGPTKTRKLRVIELPDEVVAMLRAHRMRQPPDQKLVFGHGALPYRANTYRSWLGVRCRAANVPELPPHSLRHTCASLALGAGVPVVDVAHQLGHTVETCQRTYAHFTGHGLRRMANAIGGALANRLSGAPFEIGARNGAR